GDVLDGSAGVGRRSPRPVSRVRDVVALLPGPALVAPPRAVFVTAAFGEREERAVGHRKALYRERASRYIVARKLVVVDEAPVPAGSHLERARPELDPLGLGVDLRQRVRLPTGLSAEEQRLAHRLRVLQFMEGHEIVQLARPDALEHVERA